VVRKQNNYFILQGAEHVKNGVMMKRMKMPSSPSRNPRRTYQGLWEGIKSLFNGQE